MITVKKRKRFIDKIKATNIGNVVFKQIVEEGEIEKSFRLRYKIYVEEKEWEPPNPKRLEIDQYDSHSIYFGAFQDKNLIGMLRIIDGRKAKLPIETNVQGIEKRENSVEVSRVIITNLGKSKGISDLKIFLGLFIQMYKFCKKNKVANMYIVVPKKQFRQWAMFGSSMFEPIKFAFKYKGGVYVPAWTSIILIERFVEDYIKIFNEFL